MATAGPAQAQTATAMRVGTEVGDAEIRIDSELTEVEKIYGLSRIWQEVNYNFAFFDQVPELDWDRTYQSFIPQVTGAGTAYEYYRVLQRFTALLGDGHTLVLPPPELTRRHEGFAPWVMPQYVGGRTVVANVGASLQVRIPIGSEIVAIDGIPIERYLRERVLPYIATSTEHARLDRGASRILHGRADSPIHIAYVTPEGEKREDRVLRDHESRTDRWARPVEEPKRFEFRWLEEGIAYVALNTFSTDSVAVDFESVLPELRQAKGLVIDVRRNGGGNSGVGYRIASWLTDDTLQTSKWRTREHRAAYKAWGQHSEEHRRYSEMNAWHDGGSHGVVAPNESGRRLVVPTVVLQGHRTGSAAEDFLVAIDPLPQITTVGQPSNGSTGQPLVVDLPGGGMALVVTKRDTYPDGRDFVGIGVQPDLMVAPTVEDVVTERDRALERATALLAGKSE